jgi:transposase
MIIIGVDFHPEFQQIAFVDTETGELQERRLNHPNEAESFYRELVSQGKSVRVGMEASGHGRWFERLMGELIMISDSLRRSIIRWTVAIMRSNWN